MLCIAMDARSTEPRGATTPITTAQLDKLVEEAAQRVLVVHRLAHLELGRPQRAEQLEVRLVLACAEGHAARDEILQRSLELGFLTGDLPRSPAISRDLP